MFISFDGVDGVGKSTQLNLLCQWLEQQGRVVVCCRDPGSTELGEALRDLLLGDRIKRIDRRAQMLMYMAARAQLVDEVVRPALSARKVVVSDRFLLSNVVYQGHAGGLSPDDLWSIGGVACDGLTPDVSFVLDMPPERAAARLNRPLDRLEREGDEARRRRRDGFLAEAQRDPARIVVVDADRAIDHVQADLRAAVVARYAVTTTANQSAS